MTDRHPRAQVAFRPANTNGGPAENCLIASSPGVAEQMPIPRRSSESVLPRSRLSASSTTNRRPTARSFVRKTFSVSGKAASVSVSTTRARSFLLPPVGPPDAQIVHGAAGRHDRQQDYRQDGQQELDLYGPPHLYGILRGKLPSTAGSSRTQDNEAIEW